MTAVALTPMSLRVEATLRERLNRIATAQRRTAHAVARDALAQYVNEAEALAHWNSSCDAALKDYQATGLHATHDEVVSWLDTWGKPKKQKPPQCHV